VFIFALISVYYFNQSMFQRQSRQAFPARNMIVLGAAVLGFLYFLWKNVQTAATAQAVPIEPAAEERRDSAGLRPAEWFFALREWPDFAPHLPAYAEALKAARQAAQLRDENPGFSAAWQLEGPANIGARINTVEIHPNFPNTIFVGYSHGGVWRTTDGGQNWYPVFDDQGYLAISDIEIDPNNNIVYVGTGDPNISGYPFIGDGLWRSLDNGETWAYAGLEDQRIISKVVLHPQQTNTIYASAMGLPFQRNNDRGLYKSTSGGSDWQQKLFISEQTGIIDLVMSPQNPDILYAAAWDRIRNNQESIVTGENARIWKTVDGGNTWTVLGGGLPEGVFSRIGLAIDPLNENHLFASYVNTSLEFAGLFESFDAGQTWNENPCQGLDYGFQSSFAWYFGKIRINPYNSLDIWLLGVQSYRSADGGETWQLAAGFGQGVHADHHDLAFPGPQQYLLATDGGLYLSTDNAQTWARAENIPTTQFYRVAVNPHFSEAYYGGAQDNGTTTGNASSINSWMPVLGGDGFQAVFHPTNPNIYYYEYQNGGIVGTADGSNFGNATDGIDGSDRRHWDMQYTIGQHDPEVMYTGTYRVYRGQGHLPLWTPISEDLTDGIVFGARFHTITTLNESPLDPELLYVGTTDANVWRGNPLSQTWTNISSGLPNRYVSSVKASPSDPGRVFVSQTGYKDNDFVPRIHRSDDQGATWTPISGDLPNLAVNDLVILPGHQDSVIFAATDGGVYGTTNGGVHWERLGTGIPLVPVYDLDINTAAHKLIAGTFARSAFSFPLDSLKLGENSSTFTPNGYALPGFAINPNPVSGQALLRVEHLKSGQQAEVIVADMAGRPVLRKSFKGFGRHEELLDFEGIPQGVYLAYLQTGGKQLGARKIVVTK
jgi:photosystem II stability/assembly factor-like uncharacterized protein